MMTQHMRQTALYRAVVEATVWLVVVVALVAVGNADALSPWWKWPLGWLVVFIVDWFSSRRKLLRDAERVK